MVLSKMMTKKLNHSQLLVFDLDGLIIDSLDNLSKALLEVVKNIIDDKKNFHEFVYFDKTNPGLSRFEKINFALGLSKFNESDRKQLRSKCLSEFDILSLYARCNAKIDKTIFKFKDDCQFNSKLVLLTNCDNNQLHQVVSYHELDKIFGNQIFGTPPNKSEIFPKIVNNSQFKSDRIFSISDSESDMNIAIQNSSTFVFIRQFARDISFKLKQNFLEFKSLNDFYLHLKQNMSD